MAKYNLVVEVAVFAENGACLQRNRVKITGDQIDTHRPSELSRQIASEIKRALTKAIQKAK